MSTVVWSFGDIIGVGRDSAVQLSKMRFVWMIDHNLDRRNLNAFNRGDLIGEKQNLVGLGEFSQ